MSLRWHEHPLLPKWHNDHFPESTFEAQMVMYNWYPYLYENAPADPVYGKVRAIKWKHWDNSSVTATSKHTIEFGEANFVLTCHIDSVTHEDRILRSDANKKLKEPFKTDHSHHPNFDPKAYGKRLDFGENNWSNDSDTYKKP